MACSSMAEQGAVNSLVASSSLATPVGKVPEWSKGSDCKSDGSAFEGSNPSLPTCKFCSVSLTEENQYKGNRLHACKKCYSQYQIQKGVEKKLFLIERHGGKCQGCGFQGHYSVFDFHHLDPSQKDFQIKTGKAGLSKLIKETDKCALLCANCHRLVHAGQLTLPTLRL